MGLQRVRHTTEQLNNNNSNNTHTHTHTHTHTLGDWERRRKKCLPSLIFRITDLACVRRWEQKLYIAQQTEVSILDSFLAT